MFATSQHYGAHLGPVKVPLTEDIPRYDDGGMNFYYTQVCDLIPIRRTKHTYMR